MTIDYANDYQKNMMENSKTGSSVLSQSEATHLERVLIVYKKGKTEEVIYKISECELDQFIIYLFIYF